MKKKVLSLMLVLCLFVSGCFILSACKDKRTKLESSMILLSENEFVYTGEEIKPNVTVKSGDTEIDSDNYTVSYSNNVNVGDAVITVTAKEKNKVISGSASVSFKIIPTQDTLEIDSFETFKASVQHGNNTHIVLDSTITIPESETLTVPQNVTIDCGSNKIIALGTLINNGTIRANADSKTALLEALEFANDITLQANINEAVAIKTNGKDISATINLNGYNISDTLTISNYSDSSFSNSILLDIANFNFLSESKIGKSSANYGIKIEGNENVSVSLTMLNVLGKTAVYYASNFEKSVITITSCVVTGSSYAVQIEGAANTTAIQTEFTALSGNAYRITKGNHSLSSCKFSSPENCILVISLENYNTPSSLLISNLTFDTEPYSPLYIDEVCEEENHDYFTILGHESINVEFKTIVE